MKCAGKVRPSGLQKQAHGRGRHTAKGSATAGVALLRAGKAVNKLKSENPDIQAGINIVLRALEAPIRQIVENAGVEGSIVVGKVMENKSETYGFDAQKPFVDYRFRD
jgi:chaperonin GroEL (HSP60 family)